MDADGMEESVLTPSQKVWRRVQECLRNEDFDKAIQLCNSVRSKSPDDLDAIRVKCLCLINQDNYEKALQSVSGKRKALLSPERAYCMFRLGRLEEALDVAREGGRSMAGDTRRTNALRHLEAQALYRLGMHAQAAEIYAEMYAEEDEKRGDADRGFPAVSVNLAAAYAAAGKAVEALKRFPVEDVMEEEGAAWELLYNLGTALLQRNGSVGAAEVEFEVETAETCLEQAEETCLEGSKAIEQTEDQAADEASIVSSQLAYARAIAGKPAAAVERLQQIVRSRPSDTAVALVSTTNLATLGGFKDSQEALKRLTSAMSENAERGLLPKQLEACRFNKCLLLLQCGKTEECQEELRAVRPMYPSSDLAPRIEAALLSKQGKSAEASAVLEARLKELEEAGSSGDVASLRLCLAQLLASGGDLAAAAETLEGIDAISGTPAASAALARLYVEMGKREKATGVVQEAVEAACRGEHGLEGEVRAKALLGMADWFQGEGLYCRAAETYSKVLELGPELDGEKRVQAQAALVIAYSYFDSAKSEEEASKLPYNDDLGSAEEMDPVELEMTELPCSSRVKKLVLVDKASQREERRRLRQKDHEAVLRQRAKRRDKYIAKLIAEGEIDPNKPVPKPDPERWIPRSHRSYGKRGKKRNKFVGAQGSGDGAAKDAAKLDAHAKAQSRRDMPEKIVLPPGIVIGKRAGKRR
ncbi:unnamed protein product [Ascophyllum nodosum]